MNTRDHNSNKLVELYERLDNLAYNCMILHENRKWSGFVSSILVEGKEKTMESIVFYCEKSEPEIKGLRFTLLADLGIIKISADVSAAS
jgi:hypothetical protein